MNLFREKYIQRLLFHKKQLKIIKSLREIVISYGNLYQHVKAKNKNKPSKFSL